MDDPIKIIHKYKNNNGRVQYHMYIFIGDIVSSDCMKILNKISAMDFYTTLVSVNSSETSILIKNYGEYWYEKFFNVKHLNFIRDVTTQNPQRISELKKIYGDDWFDKHFIKYKKRYEVTTYDYSSMVKRERERRIYKKITEKQLEPDEIIDYTTYSATKTTSVISPSRINFINLSESKSDTESDSNSDSTLETDSSDSDIFSMNTDSDDDSFESVSESDDMDIPQKGGVNDEPVNEAEANADIEDESLDEVMDIKEEADEDNFEEIVQQDLESADIFFQDITEPDKNLKTTTRDIKEIISQEAYDKINKKIVEFDTSKDNNMFDENIKDVYHKKYVTNQYIYKDDTIRNIKNKVCCGFLNNNKFGESPYIIPSFQYLWSEYFFNGKADTVMIGHTWIVKNSIIKLDNEPNPNISVYEELRGNLKILRDNIRRQGKIKLENDDNKILFDYDNFYTCNELFMVDILNEFGLNYDPNFEEFRNILEVYTRIYFPKIRPEEIANIVQYLKKDTPDSKKSIERTKFKTIYETINNDLILENEIMKDVELIKKKNPSEITKLHKENYIIQSFIRTFLVPVDKLKSKSTRKKLDLFRIFDNFELGETYPFIQYQPVDSTPRFRYNEKYLSEINKKETLMRWFETVSYGIGFKIKIESLQRHEYMSVNLSDNGKIDYKVQWKEEEKYTVDDIVETYNIIRRLVEKINIENIKFGINLIVPGDDDFHYAFINTIEKIELPGKFMIDHNDLSNFARCFYPYISLMIDPRKRQAKLKKTEDKGKFGTYLRFKRISNYENKSKIEHRILFYIRTFDYTDQFLADQISKEFNLTLEQALSDINSTRDKYPRVKKSRKILKKIDVIPKYKPPGIGIDIQGKQRDRYKMRVAGSRNKSQLVRILEFMHVFIYLYIEIYLYKRKDMQEMKDRLKRITKVAKRRSKVDVFVDYEIEKKSIKQVVLHDPNRLGYKSENVSGTWARECQNSGDDKQRRPGQILDTAELLKLGYVWNDKLDEFNFGHYERKVMVPDESGKKREHKLRAVKLPLDITGKNFIYYVCGPEENGKHMHVGFLGKTQNPTDNPVPCCFINDQFHSANPGKRHLYMKSIGLFEQQERLAELPMGDQLYILQETNKLYENRFAILPKYLDIFMNMIMGHEKQIKNHYLVKTLGYYFKMGVKQDEWMYLNSICAIFDLNIGDLRQKVVDILESDKKSQSIFTSLHNGDIRNRFETIDKYISYINTNSYLEYEYMNDILCLPGTIRKAGINIIIFNKKIKIIKKTLEKDIIKENYYVLCQNVENRDHILDPNRESVIIIKERKLYYPIVMIKKLNEDLKDIEITKIFTYGTDPKNLLKHIYDYYKLNCQSEFSILTSDSDKKNLINAKQTYEILKKNSQSQPEFKPKTQFVDTRFKCRYIITQNNMIVPTVPSGSIYNLPIAPNLNKYLQDYTTTISYLKSLSENLNSKPIGLYYSEKISDKTTKKYIINAIMTESATAVPIKEHTMTYDEIKKSGFILQKKVIDDIIDEEILKGPSNKIVDDRVKSISKNNFEVELYQLFRLHLSYYLNNISVGMGFKESIKSVLYNDKLTKLDRKVKIKKILYKMCSPNLLKLFNDLLNEVGFHSGGNGPNGN